jgi:CheY-like chemotaxis protein
LYNKSIDNLIEDNIKSLLIIPIVDDKNTIAIIWIALKNSDDVLLANKNIINDTILSIKKLLLSNQTKSEPISNNNLNVLVADDNIIITKFIEASLRDLDLNIIKASTGTEAVEIFKIKKNIVAIFMDEIMPNGLYGHEAIQEIRDIEQKKGLEPVIILALTSDESKETFDKLRKAGANKVLYKPIKSNEILEIYKAEVSSYPKV